MIPYEHTPTSTCKDKKGREAVRSNVTAKQLCVHWPNPSSNTNHPYGNPVHSYDMDAKIASSSFSM